VQLREQPWLRSRGRMASALTGRGGLPGGHGHRSTLPPVSRAGDQGPRRRHWHLCRRRAIIGVRAGATAGRGRTPMDIAIATEGGAFLDITLDARNVWPWRSAFALVGPTG
jgi:hypothetical protein